MPRINFTDTVIKNLKPGAKLIDYSDSGCKGLHLRVTPNGVKTFTMIYRSRITGGVENDTIGRYPEVPLGGPTGARAKVNDAWKLVANSKPVAFTDAKKNETTVDDALALYTTRKLDKMKSGSEVVTALTTIVKREKWGALPLASLEKAAIMDAVYHIRDERGSPKSAGNCQQMLSTWLKWCTQHDLIKFNPIAGMPNVRGEVSRRDRRLSADELRKVWIACHDPHNNGLLASYADAMLLILTTTARPGMVCGLSIEEVFGFAQRPKPERRLAGALADFPKERMKKKRPFVLPLNSLAQDIILRRLDLMTTGQLLFETESKEPKDKGKQLRVRRLSAITKELSITLGFKRHFTPHDLRRTGSKMLREFFTRNEVGLLLSHEAEGSDVMKHYDPEDRWDELAKKRLASDKLAEQITEIVGGEVVEIRRAA